jgi:hypothetical protein
MGLTLLLGALAIFLAAVGGVLVCTLAMLRFAARASAKHGDRATRVRAGLIAIGFGAGLIASAAVGFMGISALLYYTALPTIEGK